MVVTKNDENVQYENVTESFNMKCTIQPSKDIGCRRLWAGYCPHSLVLSETGRFYPREIGLIAMQ